MMTIDVYQILYVAFYRNGEQMRLKGWFRPDQEITWKIKNNTITLCVNIVSCYFFVHGGVCDLFHGKIDEENDALTTLRIKRKHDERL